MQVQQKQIDSISINAVGVVQVTVATVFEDDDGNTHRAVHLHVLTPGQDVSNQDSSVQAICQATWTPEMIEKYELHMQSVSLSAMINPDNQEGAS